MSLSRSFRRREPGFLGAATSGCRAFLRETILGRGLWKDFDEVATLRRSRWTRQPQDNEAQMDQWIAGWQRAVKQLLA